MISEKPNDAPDSCPGTSSEDAGKADACEGCPNQSVCASGPQIDPDISLITEKMLLIKNKILILSGKGGVGKSTFTMNLGFSLSTDENVQVGIMDVDITGPSIPRMCGMEKETIHQSNSGWSPVYVLDNLSVMSIGFMLPNLDDAVIWRGPKKNGIIKQFIRDVDWGELDYLLVDTPPGTSDEHLSTVQYLKESGISGAILITTPQEMSLQDVRKEINFCRKVGVPIIGVVENMSIFTCPNCHHELEIYTASSGGGMKMAQDMNVPFLGSIPLDPNMVKCADQGNSFLDMFPSSKGFSSYNDIVHKIKQFLVEN